MLTSLTLLSSCHIMGDLGKKNKTQEIKPLNFLEKAPEYKINQFLKDDLKAFAIVQDNDGRIIDGFVAKIQGEWENNKGTVKFVYNFIKGKKDSRTWLITTQGEKDYNAIGHDFNAPAKGRQTGNVSEISYQLSYDYNGQKEQIDFTENLYMVDKNSAIVISDMRIGQNKIGKMIISLQKINNIKRIDNESHEQPEIQ